MNEEKRFTQEEVTEIVEKRMARAKEKTARAVQEAKERIREQEMKWREALEVIRKK